MDLKTQLEVKINFIGFIGNYGGDEYEKIFCERLQLKGENVSLNTITAKRKNGIKTLFGLIKLILLGFISKGKLVRPFGIPIYRYKMTVILHHFDQSGAPFYTYMLEMVELFFLKLLSRPLKIKFITVSEYWALWVNNTFKANSFVIYNTVNPIAINVMPKAYIAKKYNLCQNSEWIFLGSNQSKKGGDKIVQYLNSNFENETHNIQLIQSGKTDNSNLANLAVRWIEEDDYISFIKSCSIVIANSQFNEGWCRVLHEAALLGTPISGSGAGGMGELLALINGKSNYTIDEMSHLIINKKLRIIPDKSTINRLHELSDTNLLKWYKALLDDE